MQVLPRGGHITDAATQKQHLIDQRTGTRRNGSAVDQDGRDHIFEIDRVVVPTHCCYGEIIDSQFRSRCIVNSDARNLAIFQWDMNGLLGTHEGLEHEAYFAFLNRGCERVWKLGTNWRDTKKEITHRGTMWR